jgi:cysteine synthase A
VRAANILETIGDTPHIRINRLFADRPHIEVWMKAERANPGGSIKDRIGLSMLEDAPVLRWRWSLRCAATG